MTSYRIRPRFKYVSQYSKEEIQNIVKEKLEKQKANCTGMVGSGYIVLKIPYRERHFWSPQLSLSLEDHEEGGTLIRGLYGPNPNVWIAFTYGYAFIALICLFIGLVGFSKVSLDQEAPILWVIPVLLIVAALMYLTAQMGQKLGTEQTFILHQFYEYALGEKVKVK